MSPLWLFVIVPVVGSIGFVVGALWATRRPDRSLLDSRIVLHVYGDDAAIRRAVDRRLREMASHAGRN